LWRHFSHLLFSDKLLGNYNHLRNKDTSGLGLKLTDGEPGARLHPFQASSGDMVLRKMGKDRMEVCSIFPECKTMKKCEVEKNGAGEGAYSRGAGAIR
jgi:hypothetical protein